MDKKIRSTIAHLKDEDIQVIENTFLFLSTTRDSSSFENHNLYQIILWSNPEIIKRFIKWLKQLNEFYPAHSISYTNIVEGIIWAFIQRNLITSQTQHQFNISISIVKEYLTSDIDIVSINNSQFLLTNILIYSKRPDLCLKSFTKEIKHQNNRKKASVFNKNYSELIKYFFLKFPVNNFLVDNITKLDTKETKCLIIFLETGSLKKALSTSYDISKKEAALLTQNLINFNFKKNLIVDRYITLVKILKEFPEEFELLNTLLEECKIFREQFSTFKDDILFWKGLFRFFVNYKIELNTQQVHRLNHYVDFFEYKRYYDEEPFTYSLKGRTFNSVETQINNWQFSKSFSEKYENSSWKPLPINKWASNKYNMPVVIEEITTGSRLLLESKLLSHCAFSYIISCEKGQTHLFSYSKLMKTKKEPYLTIEVRDSIITQIGGRFNSIASSEEIRVINNWAIENNLTTYKENSY